MTAYPRISKRALAIKPSATLAVAQRAGELRASGKQVLNFSAGEPDFKPPRAVREAVAEFSREQPILYAPVPGTPALRDAVAAAMTEIHGRRFERSDVIVSCGAKHSLANLFLATLDPGDEVVIPAPYWVSYPDMVGLAEGKPVIVESTRAQGWRPSPEALEAVVGPRTRFLVLNSPSNPTGAGYRAEEIRALAEVLATRAPQAWIVVDDIYRQLCYDGYQAVSAYRALEGITDQIVVVDGVSKTYAMTGWRIGFTAAPPSVVAAMGRIQSQTTSGAATPAQHAALVALTDPTVAQDVDQMRTAFARRRGLMLDGLAAAPGVEVSPPDGAFYVFADVSRHCGPQARHASDIELATWLLEEKLVATVPGTEFGAPGNLRLSYATDDQSILEGCARMREALSSLPTA
jgi:aspartate aminotransferase